MREHPQSREGGLVAFRDVVAMLAMLIVVTAIALIVIGMIYLFAPPARHRAPPLRTTQQQRLTIASLSFLRTAEHGADALRVVAMPILAEILLNDRPRLLGDQALPISRR